MADVDQRIVKLSELLKMVEPIPQEWLAGPVPTTTDDKKPDKLQPLPCTRYSELIEAWRNAMQWRPEMGYALSTMLAVALSTDQIGDQLFLQVIGDAGSGKTRFCDAMLVSDTCHALEHITGFHSGWKDSSGDDFSLLARINHKTLITPEGDVMMRSPKFSEIMSQQRRIFDGKSGTTFKNKKEDVSYDGLRTPWIIAGTPAMLTSDQAQLGDRFLRLFIEAPDDSEKEKILKRVGFTAIRSVRQSVNGSPESNIEENICRAYQLTGGYIDYLRKNAERLLQKIEIDEEAIVDYCAKLGTFTASLRARNTMRSDDIQPTAEVPTRLTHQFVRMACCMGVVLNRGSIDSDVLTRVRKVAIDTSRGQSLDILRYLYKHPEGSEQRAVSNNVARGDYTVSQMLVFMHKLKIVEHFVIEHPKASGVRKWRLTDKMKRLYEEVAKDA